MSQRKSMSRKQRADFFTTHGGICCYCKGRIQVTEAWDAAHIIDRALLFTKDRFTGKEVLMYPHIDPDGEDIQAPAHKKCHAGHTFGGGNQAIAKANRLYDKHNGFRKPSSFPKNPDPWGKQWKSRTSPNG
jgi:hypothetical protein